MHYRLAANDTVIVAGDAKIAGSAMDALHVDQRVENSGTVVLDI